MLSLVILAAFGPEGLGRLPGRIASIGSGPVESFWKILGGFWSVLCFFGLFCCFCDVVLCF